MRLSRAIDEFLLWIQSQRTKESWWRYRFICRSFLKQTGNKEMDNVRPADVSRWLAWCAKRGNCVRTQQTNLKNLRTLWRWAIECHYAERSPFREHHKQQVPELPPPETPTENDWQRLDAARGKLRYPASRENAIWLLTAVRFFGLRKEEGRTALAENVDIEKATLRVLGKGRKIRVLPIPVPALETMRYLQERAKVAGSPWLAFSRHRKPVGKTGWHRLWHELQRLAGFSRHYRYHNGRHAYALRFVNVSIESTRRLLGHSRLDTTQRYLAGLRGAEEMRKAVDAVWPAEEEEEKKGVTNE